MRRALILAVTAGLLAGCGGQHGGSPAGPADKDVRLTSCALSRKLHAGVVHGVLQGDERPEGLAQDRAAAQTQSVGQRRHVGSHVSKGPGLGRRLVRLALGALVDEDQTVAAVG